MKTTAAFLAMALLAKADDLILKDGRKIEWKSIADAGEKYDVETKDGQKLSVKKDDVERFMIAGAPPPLTGATFTKLQKSKPVNVTGSIDLKKDLFGGAGIESKWKGTALSCDWKSDAPVRLQIPVKIGDEYDFSLTVERKDGTSDFYMGLLGGGVPFLVRFDNETKTGIPGWKMTDMGGFLLKKDQPTTISCYVRKDSVIVTVDKKEVVNWKGDAWKFAMPEANALPENRTFLFFGSQKIVGTVPNLWMIHKIALNIKE